MISPSTFVVGAVSFGQAAVGTFVSIGSVAVMVSLYIWRHIQTTDISAHVETIVEDRTVKLIQEVDFITGGNGTISDGLSLGDVPRTRELVAKQQRERQAAIEQDFHHASRQFARVSLLSFSIALSFTVYQARGLTIQPWPPDTYDIPLTILLALMSWALYTGIRTFKRASKAELELQSEAEQCEQGIKSDND